MSARSRLAPFIFAASVAAAVASCTGAPREAKSDTELQSAYNHGLARQARNRPFEMREVVPGRWTKLWFFGG